MRAAFIDAYREKFWVGPICRELPITQSLEMGSRVSYKKCLTKLIRRLVWQD